ncbi:MAG: nucleotidyl transferase AbiEii/AbiGii toxin family protein [Candidatus Bipolaricaulia bacterium]
MKDRALQLVREATGVQKANVLREYLQAHILYSLQSARAFEQLAFVGGIALRFLYGLKRYSEDLDFSLERPEGYDFQSLTRQVVSDLTKAGFEVTQHPRSGKTVHSAYIRLPGLLYEAGLSPHPEEKLSIKIEIDTRPPAGAETETTVVNLHFLLALWHYDLPSLMAGKLHALLSRSYTKGRDIYDLLWYLTQEVRPNTTLLNNALHQTGWDGPQVNSENWGTILKARLEALEWEETVEDVAAFLEDPGERQLLTPDNIISVLQRSAKR